MFKKILFTFILFSLLNNLCYSQGNNCANATVLTIDGACDGGNITNNVQDAPNISTCAGNGNFRREGWYTFTVAGGTTNVTITANTTNRNLFLQLISSTVACTGLTQIACANDDTTNNSNQTESITTTLANGIYYVKVVNVAGGNNNMNLNSICITSPLSNDDCTNATSLTVNPNLNCGSVTSGTTVSATESITAITCNGFTGNADDDVWYNFVATANDHVIEVTQGTIGDFVVDLRSGACDGTSIDCSDGFGDETINATGLTIGNTYYVRVYSYGGNGNQGTFDICVGTEPPCTITPNDPVSPINFVTVTSNSI